MTVLAGNIQIRTTRKGQRRAYRWSMACARWFPMPLDQAEFILATEGE